MFSTGYIKALWGVDTVPLAGSTDTAVKAWEPAAAGRPPSVLLPPLWLMPEEATFSFCGIDKGVLLGVVGKSARTYLPLMGDIVSYTSPASLAG